MLRFIDLSQDYWTDPECNGGPICAFLSTNDDRFLETDCGAHTFIALDEILEHELRERMLCLIPMGFFND
jgi:hypothetical protein